MKKSKQTGEEPENDHRMKLKAIGLLVSVANLGTFHKEVSANIYES